jgi:membrane-associated phospholipid phosphatase
VRKQLQIQEQHPLNILHDLQWVLPLRSAEATQLALAFSWLGYTTFIMFFMAIGYWTSSKAIFFRLLLLVAVNALINAFAKDLFQDPRPPLELRLDDLVGASYGLPSGHAQLAVVLWIGLALEVRKTWTWFVFPVIALGVMFSRLYLGVHDLEDVLVGAALGAGSLAVFHALRANAWIQARSLPQQSVVIALVASAALAQWPGVPPDYIPLLAGWLVAALWCLRLDIRYIGFVPPSAWWKKLLAGLAGAGAFYAEQLLLKWLALHWPMQPMAWSLMQGVVSGTFVSFAMPWLLHMLRLCDSNPSADTRPQRAD